MHQRNIKSANFCLSSGTTYATLFAIIFIAMDVTDDISAITKSIARYNNYFELSPTRTKTGRFLSPFDLGNSDYCGHCHFDVFQQWNASAHHFSSFNNPVYRKVAITVAQNKGKDVAKFCASCHDPVPLLSGEMDALDVNSWSANAGITCLSCHRITNIYGPNGKYEVDPPMLHPFSLSENPLLQTIHKKLLQITPRLHRNALSKPFYSSPKYCAVCHTLIVPKEINGVKDLTLLNEHESWLSSSYSTHRNDPNKGNGQNCLDCHMPLIPSADPAAKNGMIRSHRFAAANTMLPTFNRDHKQLEAIEDFLTKNRIVKVDIHKIHRTSKHLFSEPGLAKANTGDILLLEIKVSNTGVGHTFPGGTIDSNQAWLEIRVSDATGENIFVSGHLDKYGLVNDDAKFFGATFVDLSENVTDRSTTTTDAIAVREQRLIPPGDSKLVYYSFSIPKYAKFPISIEAKLNWRKYSPKFMHWVFDGRDFPELPVTVIDKTHLLFDGLS